MNKIERTAQILRFVLDRFLIVFFFLILIIYSSREISDLDLWLHLKTGEVIVAQKTVPAADIFSFAIQGKPWINHEWLFQVLAYLSYATGSSDGLIAMQNAVIIAVFLVLFFCGRNEKNYLFLFVVLYLTLLATAYRFTIRPDIFSLLFLALYLALLKRFAEEKSRLIWSLPVLQAIWINMHGFSFLGPLLVLLLLAGEVAKKILPLPPALKETRRLDKGQLRQLLAVFGLILTAHLCNPQGIQGAAYPLSVLGQLAGKGKIVFQYIVELARPITLKTVTDIRSFLFYKAMILGALFTFRINARRLDISSLGIWICFLLLSFLAIRNIAYFCIVSAFVALDNVGTAFRNGKTLPLQNLPRNIKIIAYYASIVFLLFYAGKGARQYLESANFNFDTYELKSALWGTSELRFPKKAVDFLLRHDFPGRIFNDFNSGAYLVGRVFPRRQVFIDGRTELYGPDFFENYVAVGEGRKKNLDETLARYDIQGFFLTTPQNDLHMGLVKYLWQHPQWKIVYFDEFALIFLKDTSENSALINRFHFDLKEWAPPEPDFLKVGIAFRNPAPFLARGGLLSALRLHDAAAREAKIALDIMPNNAEALKFMADDHKHQKNYGDAFKCIRNAIISSPGDLSLRTRLALIYLGLGEKEKALKVADNLVNKAPKFAEGFYTKALVIVESDPEKAKQLLQEAAKLAAKEPKYHELLGDWAHEAGNFAEAKKEWEAAMEYDSANQELKKKLDGV